jgi:hypothetical protein
MTRFTAGYSYTGIRHWSFSAQGEYDRGDSIANVTGIYGDYGGGVTVSRRVARFFNVIFSVSGIKFDSPSIQGYNHIVYNVNAGMGFSPGDVPVRVW